MAHDYRRMTQLACWVADRYVGDYDKDDIGHMVDAVGKKVSHDFYKAYGRKYGANVSKQLEWIQEAKDTYDAEGLGAEGTSEKCDKCGGKTTKGRHHKHCRACVNCTNCGWSNTHNMMFKDYTPWMGYGAEGICICGSSCNCDCGCAESGVCNCGPSCPCSCGCGVANAESFEALGKPDAPYDEGYKDELDESLGERDGAESTKSQSKGSRRRESMGTERSMGRRPYSGVRTMDAEGNPKKTTSTLYAKFYVGHTDKKGELAGNGKFKSYDDALAKAKEVAKKEGHSRIVSTRGFALWTSDGQGLFQAGKSTAEAKKFYRAEDGSIDMNGYATEYMEAEDGFFEAVGDDYRTSMKRSNPLSIHYIPPGSPLKPTRPSDDRPTRRRPFKRPFRRPLDAHEDIEIETDIQAEKAKQQHRARKERGIGFRRFLKLGKHSKGAEGAGIRGGRNRWVIGEMIMAGVLVVGYLNYRKKSS